MISCVVVDDDPDVLDVFCELLNLIGVNVLATGKDGKDAEIQYKKHRPDIIFVDLLMPEYDGLNANKKIMDLDPNAKIIVVTGDLKADESLLLDSYNVTSVIYKPFDMHVVKQVLMEKVFA